MCIESFLAHGASSAVALSQQQYKILANMEHDIDCLMQDCSISIANALEIQQSCTKPSIYLFRP